MSEPALLFARRRGLNQHREPESTVLVRLDATGYLEMAFGDGTAWEFAPSDVRDLLRLIASAVAA